MSNEIFVPSDTGGMEQTMNEIISSYDMIRERNYEALQNRMDEVFAVSNEIQKLFDEIYEVQIKRMKNAVTGADEKTKEETDSKLKLLNIKKSELLNKLGFETDYLDPIYTCKICLDTGYSDQEKTVICSCVKAKYYLNKLKDFEDIPPLEEFSFDIFADKAQKKEMQAMVSYLIKYLQNYPKNKKKIIICTGATGTGKTYLLRSLAKSLLERHIDTIYTIAYEMFADFHAHRLGEDADIEKYENCEVLITDDLGTETLTKNVTVEYFYRLIELRKDKTAFFATNLTPNDNNFKDKYTDRIVSRLTDKNKAVWFMIAGVDLRNS